jgi:hypothetical protein
MVLVDIPEKEISQYEEDLVNEITELDIKYCKVISVVEKNYQHFMKWVNDLPYYYNVYNEGIHVYG